MTEPRDVALETFVIPERPVVAEPPTLESPVVDPPLERHDPFAGMRDMPWMDRRRSPAGRIMARLRPELEAFATIEGREPNGADIDAMVKKHVDEMAPILRRERATDMVYDVLEERRAARVVPGRMEGRDPGSASSEPTPAKPEAAPAPGDTPPGGLQQPSDERKRQQLEEILKPPTFDLKPSPAGPAHEVDPPSDPDNDVV